MRKPLRPQDLAHIGYLEQALEAHDLARSTLKGLFFSHQRE